MTYVVSYNRKAALKTQKQSLESPSCRLTEVNIEPWKYIISIKDWFPAFSFFFFKGNFNSTASQPQTTAAVALWRARRQFPASNIRRRPACVRAEGFVCSRQTIASVSPRSACSPFDCHRFMSLKGNYCSVLPAMEH